MNTGFAKLNDHGLRIAFMLSINNCVKDGIVNDNNGDEVLEVLRVLFNGLVNIQDDVAKKMNNFALDRSEEMNMTFPNYGIDRDE